MKQNKQQITVSFDNGITSTIDENVFKLIKELENQIKNVGGKTGSTVNKNTFVLIVKDLSESSGKMEDAKKHGVSIMEKDGFIKKYL